VDELIADAEHCVECPVSGSVAVKSVCFSCCVDRW
jgi:hypothetical protein